MKKFALLFITALSSLCITGCDLIDSLNISFLDKDEIEQNLDEFHTDDQNNDDTDDEDDDEGTDDDGSGIGGQTDEDGSLTGYYSGIKLNSSNLLKELNSLNSRKRKSVVGYKNLPSYYSKTDKGTKSGQVTAFYKGTSDSYSGKMNREHVWPNSLGGSSVENDIHMPRPTYSNDNTSRGNEYYVEGKHGPAKPWKEKGWDPGAFADQDETYRGDSARIVFYCCIANTNLKLIDTDGANKPANTMGKLSDLLKWNLKYSVKEREITRNDAIETIQGNRNPFIDHPEFACRIWGSYNETTKSICGGKY